MNEDEAEAWAKRFTRIWAPDKPVGLRWWLSSSVGELDFYAPVGESVVVSIVRGTYFKVTLDRLPPTPGKLRGRLVWEDGAISTSEEMGRRFGLKEGFSEFGTEWLPFFRRGCWLSGCPIEASAHEKMEWMRSFSEEEIKSWNLKM